MAGTKEEAPFPLTDVDRWVLSQTDDEFHLQSWEDLKRIVGDNDLEALKRRPSDLRRYIWWTADTRAAYGSITDYLVAERMPAAWGRPPFRPRSATPFADPSDYRVRLNDWPYGLEEGIVHIVVWLRTEIETDPATGDMTPESRRLVGEFVERFFARDLRGEGEGEGEKAEDRVLWFKNWVRLQSVRALEHVHVLVRGVDEATLERWTREEEWHRK